MGSKMLTRVLVGWTAAALLMTACSIPVSIPETAPANTFIPPTLPPPPIATSIATQTVSPQPEPQAEHRIGVRQEEFILLDSGAKFIPRGVNYAFVPQGGGFTNLVLQVGVYDPQRTREDFARLAGLGYNTVRVFLDQCNRGPDCIARTDAPGLNPAYLDNIADMMLAARETGVYILFTSNDLPDDGGYSEEANRGSGDDFAGYRNSFYLRPQAIRATRRYWRDLLTGLDERNAAFDAVLAWQLLNEQWMFRDQPPLSLTSGMVETTTGTYDMSDPQQKKQMVSDGIVYYIAQMKEEILLHDPTALVTMGFFVPELTAPDWYVETASLLEKSVLDFFDFHAYPGGLSIDEYVGGFGMAGYTAKPIILGEYGAFRHLYPDLDTAARVVTEFAADACVAGFDGWLYWTYYPSDASAGDRTWGLTDEDAYLLELFAPVNQPDACVAAEVPNDNLAYHKPVRASASLSEEPAAFAVDDDPTTQWGAGNFPVQWIEIDLQASHRIREVRLMVAQWPEGSTTHQVQTRASAAEAYVIVHEFTGYTRGGDWLVFTPDAPIENVQFLRIKTLVDPSWVAWAEIQVIGEVQP